MSDGPIFQPTIRKSHNTSSFVGYCNNGGQPGLICTMFFYSQGKQSHVSGSFPQAQIRLEWVHSIPSLFSLQILPRKTLFTWTHLERFQASLECGRRAV